jgi:salicylate hydroxylase
VTIFERFETAQPIGSGLMLQPTGIAVLHQLGLAEAALAAGQRIDRIHGEAGRRVVLDVRYRFLRHRDAFAIGIHRAALFDPLYSAVGAAGVATATGRTVASCRVDAKAAWLRFDSGAEEGPFDFIVDALGTRSALAPPVGRDLAYGALWTNVALSSSFDPHSLSQRYRRASVMAGVLPLSSKEAALFWSLRADRYREWAEAGLDAWKADVLALWPATAPLLDRIRSIDQLTFARYAHKTLGSPVENRLIHIGDAWHSASPQLGQGANMALLDAFALARALRAAPDADEGLARAASLRRRHVLLYQYLTAILTPVYQSDGRLIPLMRDWLMGPASKLWPLTSFQAALVSGLVGSPLRRLDLGFAPMQSPR